MNHSTKPNSGTPADKDALELIDQLQREIPEAMQSARRWLLHRKKQPFYADGTARNGTLDSPEDQARFATFTDACNAYSRDPARWSGLGFALGPDRDGGHWQGIDFDHTDKNDALRALIDGLPGYVERSPSGTGVHAVGYGPVFRALGSNRSGIEAYSAGRFFTCTGDAIQGDIEDLAPFVADVLTPLHSPQSSPDTEPPPGAIPSNDDLLAALLAGESVHGAAVKLVGRMVADGVPDATIRAVFGALALQVAAARGAERANALNGSEIERLIKGAKEKGYASAAPPQDHPEPTPLPSLPAVPQLPLDILPDDLRPWVEDCADRARFPADFVAVASMVALGSVIGRRIGIRLKRDDDWTEYPNVWGLNIGPPSALKSPAAGQALKPLKRLQVTADERNAQAAAAHEAEMEAYQLRKGAAKKDNAKKLSKDPCAKIEPFTEQPPDAPDKQTYWTSNATAEALGVLLAENPNGLLVERDEISALLKDLEDDANATARGLYLSGWSGKEGYRFDRIIRGTTTLPKYALSVFGGIQPGPLSRYVRGAATGDRADGLLQRFQLATWPDPVSFEYVDRAPNAVAREEAFNLFSRTDSLDFNFIGHPDRFDDDVKFVRLQPDAQELFIEWYSAFMLERRENEANRAESESLAAHLGKYPGLLGKLALILHIADDYQTQAISERTLTKALAWLEYLTPHAQRIYHAAESPETTAANLLLARLRRRALPETFKPWELVRNGWHGLTDRDAVKRACRLLLEYGWLIELPPSDRKATGRPADPVYSVSPRVEV